MADHLSFSLGAAKFKAYKYVPYGRVQEVMPYLVRRAQENSGLLGGATAELKMIRAELKRRMFPGSANRTARAAE
jgi:proline dehydrogenase